MSATLDKLTPAVSEGGGIHVSPTVPVTGNRCRSLSLCCNKAPVHIVEEPEVAPSSTYHG